jgi:hypothetical protein
MEERSGSANISADTSTHEEEGKLAALLDSAGKPPMPSSDAVMMEVTLEKRRRQVKGKDWTLEETAIVLRTTLAKPTFSLSEGNRGGVGQKAVDTAETAAAAAAPSAKQGQICGTTHEAEAPGGGGGMVAVEELWRSVAVEGKRKLCCALQEEMLPRVSAALQEEFMGQEAADLKNDLESSGSGGGGGGGPSCPASGAEGGVLLVCGYAEFVAIRSAFWAGASLSSGRGAF